MTTHFLQPLTVSLLFLWHPACLTVLSDLLLPGHTFSSLRSHQPLLFQSFLPMLPYLFSLFLLSLFSLLILLFSVPYSALMQNILYYSHPVQRLSILLSDSLLLHDPDGIYCLTNVPFLFFQLFYCRRMRESRKFGFCEGRTTARGRLLDS